MLPEPCPEDPLPDPCALLFLCDEPEDPVLPVLPVDEPELPDPVLPVEPIPLFEPDEPVPEPDEPVPLPDEPLPEADEPLPEPEPWATRTPWDAGAWDGAGAPASARDRMQCRHHVDLRSM